MKSQPVTDPRRAGIEALEPRQLLAAPDLDPIDAQQIPAGKFLHVPVFADYDGQDSPTFTVTNPPSSTGITAEFRPASNTFIHMETTLGGMVLQLFDDLAPDTVRRQLGLIKSGFFEGLAFHRVIQGFVAQGGDPNGDGSGGPGYDFADEFDTRASFAGVGALAMANSGKDTNGSQFFITQGSPRFLDYNHTIWGQLITGQGALDRIIATDGPDNDDSPDGKDPVIKRINILPGYTGGVLMIRADTANSTGSVTVTVNTEQGSSSQVFTASGEVDLANNAPVDSPPILGPVGNFVMQPNTTFSFALSGFDADRDNPAARNNEFAAELIDLSHGTVSTEGNVVTFTPARDFTGPVDMLIGIRSAGATNRGTEGSNPFDTQVIRVGVGDKRATAVGRTDLFAAAGAPTPGMIVASFTDADTSSTPADWSAEINWGDASLTEGTVVQTGRGTFNVVGSHAYDRAADDMPVTVTLNGSLGARTVVNSVIDVQPLAELTGRATLIVNGSSGNDQILIRRLEGGNYRVTVNGRVRNVEPPAVGVRRFNIASYAGNDLVNADVDRISAIDAGGGNDTVLGGRFNDTILGGSGRDRLFGNGSSDVLFGGAGADFIDGGSGNDAAGSSPNDTFENVENLI